MSNLKMRIHCIFKKLEIGDTKLDVPFKVTQLLTLNNFILIKMFYTTRDEDGNLLPNADETLKVLSQNIWCFNSNGELVWISPEIFSEEQKKTHFERWNEPLVATYSFIDFCKTNDDHVVIGTDFGVEMEIEIATGKLINRIHRNVK